MLHRITIGVLGLFLSLSLAGCGDGEDGGSQRHVLVSGGQTGVYYPTAVAISKAARAEGLSLEVQSSGGSVANARLLAQGEADFAMMQNDIAAYAREGQEMFDEKIDSIVGVAALYPEHVQVVVRADSGINSIADLKGKRVAIGALGSGTKANAVQVLEAYGLSESDLGKVEHLDPSGSRDYLQDGQVDAGFFTFGVGMASLLDLASMAEIRLIPVEGAARDRLMAKHPFYRKAVIPAGAYGEDTPSDVPTVSVMATLVCREDVPEETVRKVLAGVLGNLEEFRKGHKRLEAVNAADAQANLSLPAHPGAAAYYKAHVK